MSERNEKGQYVEGNLTQFKDGNEAASKYKEEYCEAIIAFFSKPSTRLEYKERYRDGEVIERTPIIVAEEFPTIELFAESIGVHHETLRNWAQSHPRFRVAYQRARNIQLGKLANNAMTGLYNPKFAIFFAENNFDMTEKAQVDNKVQHIGLDEDTKRLLENAYKRLGHDEL